MSLAPPFRVRPAGVEELERLQPMFIALYQLQHEQGMRVALAPDGFERWVQSLARVLGRFAVVLVAERDGTAVGFLAGRVRVPTPPFAGDPAGFVSEVFVSEACRGAGLGKALLTAAEEWFAEQGVRRMELQVLVGNPSAAEAYRRQGWRDELIQMAKTVGADRVV